MTGRDSQTNWRTSADFDVVTDKAENIEEFVRVPVYDEDTGEFLYYQWALNI